MNEKKESIEELLNKLSKRLIIPLEENEIVCPICKGLRMIYKPINDKEGCIENCRDCYTGKVYKCKYCGKLNKTDYCDCKQASEEREIIYQQEKENKRQELFKKAIKIKFEDYNGYFNDDNSEHVIDGDEIYDWLYSKIKYDKVTDEELPKFLWAMIPEDILDLDLQDIIYNQCDDNGYEDMSSNLNMEDDDLQKAQEHINKWHKKQGDSVNLYTEDTSTAVLLEDIIKEIREKIKREDD